MWGTPTTWQKRSSPAPRCDGLQFGVGLAQKRQHLANVRVACAREPGLARGKLAPVAAVSRPRRSHLIVIGSQVGLRTVAKIAYVGLAYLAGFLMPACWTQLRLEETRSVSWRGSVA